MNSLVFFSPRPNIMTLCHQLGSGHRICSQSVSRTKASETIFPQIHTDTVYTYKSDDSLRRKGSSPMNAITLCYLDVLIFYSFVLWFVLSPESWEYLRASFAGLYLLEKSLGWVCCVRTHDPDERFVTGKHLKLCNAFRSYFQHLLWLTTNKAWWPRLPFSCLRAVIFFP